MIKIMIVDDQTLMRYALREVIRQEENLELVAEAANGFEAIEQASRIQPDVIVMDLDMPDCDGFVATEQILQNSPLSRIIIFTAYHYDLRVVEAIQRGAVGYITKDIEPDALVHAIHCAARNDFYLPGSLAAPLVAHLRAFGTASKITPSNSRREPDSLSSAEARVESNNRCSLHHPMPQPGKTIDNPLYTPPPPSDIPPSSITSALPYQPFPMLRILTQRELEILDLIRKGRKNREIAEELHIAASTVHKHVQHIFAKLHVRNRTEAIYLSSSPKVELHVYGTIRSVGGRT